MLALEGTHIGPYRLVHQIGSGGMGTVWMAQHAMLGRKAAIKVLHSSLSSQLEIVARFFNEARAASQIAEPGIVQIFDFGVHEERSAYIVMELLEGEPLDRRLERAGRLPVVDALRIVRQVASALGAAHARGIVHRDLKPANIFLARDVDVPGGERAKVLDFGVAKLTTEGGVRTQTSALLGTPAFMSPEQCRGARDVDARTDVYALGCVLFTLITGRPPFEAEGMGEVLLMQLSQPAPRASTLAPWIPQDVDDLIACCLAKNPEERYASASALARVCDSLLAWITIAPVSVSQVHAVPSPSQLHSVAMLPTVVGATPEVAAPKRRGFRGWLLAALTAGCVMGVASVMVVT